MGGGGFLGDIVEIGTGGMVKSGKTKGKIKAAESAAQQQKILLDKQQAEIAEEEAARKKRVTASRQGRRGLLYSGTTETGVSDTLGG